MELLEKARTAGEIPSELAVALALHYDALEWVDEAMEATDGAERSADWSELGSALTFLWLRSDDYLQAEAAARRALELDVRARPAPSRRPERREPQQLRHHAALRGQARRRPWRVP